MNTALIPFLLDLIFEIMLLFYDTEVFSSYSIVT